MVKIVFYTTLGCHLCEEAEQQLRHLVTANAVEVEAVDISSSEDLVALYGIRIPVLKNMENEQELDWPFDYPELLQFARFAD
ncbi:MAG: thiol-disulfide isomerase/thioredoxin [Pseudohongiellaceae bacterium]|jgi:thiol-disulfide isomerase/thioredoxin